MRAGTGVGVAPQREVGQGSDAVGKIRSTPFGSELMGHGLLPPSFYKEFVKPIEDQVRQKYASASFADCYVAYFDILGMRKLVREGYGRLSEIFTAIEASQAVYSKTSFMGGGSFFSPQHVRLTNLSDAIVLSTSAREVEGISRLLGFTSNVLHELLKLPSGPVFLRGGIARGDIYHEPPFVFGPALVDAYELESQVAGAMRCIISDSLFNDSGFRSYQARGGSHLHLDWEDGRYFLKFASPSNREMLLATAASVLASTADERIRRKYEWLRRYAESIPSADA